MRKFLLSLFLIIFSLPGIAKEVKHAAKMEFGKKLDIKAKKMRLLSKSRSVEFSENVLVSGELFKMSCNKLKGHYAENGALSRILCEGKVKLIQENRKVFGEKADYNLKEAKVRFFGKSRVEQLEGELEGLDAQLFIDKDELVMDNVKMKLNREGVDRVVSD